MRGALRTMTIYASLIVLTTAIDATAADAVYQQRCAMCHGADGDGVPGIYPRLRDRIAAIAAAEGGVDYLVQVVLFGLTGSIKVDEVSIEGIMPGSADLSDQDVAAVLNYLAAGMQTPVDAAPAGIEEADVKRLRTRAVTPSEVHQRRVVTVEQ